ncbi:MAG: GNAT family N-acetyltransferase [Leptolyngbyaceae cyanobacterium]
MIRAANKTDEGAISQCVHTAFEPYISRLGKPPGPMLDDYAQVIDQDQVFVITLDGVIAGLTVLKKAQETLLLETLAVHPIYQGQGLGKTLLNYVETLAAKEGYETLQLYTHEKMTENIVMYQRCGYVEIKRCTEKGYQRVYMEKPVKHLSDRVIV